MKYRLGALIIVLLGTFGVMLINGTDASGVTSADYIENVNVDNFTTYCNDGSSYTSGGFIDCDSDDHGGFGETYFDVSYSFKSSCSGCTASGSWVCDGRASQAEWTGEPSSISVSCNDSGNCTVKLTKSGKNASGSTYQPIKGGFKKPAKKTLKGVAINLNGNKIGGDDYDPFDSDTVKHGDGASVSTDRDIDIDGKNYHFQGWLNSKTSSDYSTSYDKTGLTYSVSSLTSNKTVYAVYAKDRTLKGTSIDESGNSLSSISGLGDKKDTVHYNEPASVTRGTAVGYTFLGWRDNADDRSYSKTSATYSVANLRDDITRYATYVRNEFAGKMTASGGIDTGWTEDNSNKSASIDCDNYSTGCTATFQPRLKTIKGSGTTAYSVQRNKNDAGWTNVSTTPAAPFAPSSETDGTAINKRSGNYNEKLYPGEKVCYRMSFYPYGAKANDTAVTLTACVTAKTAKFHDKSTVTSGSTTGNTGWKNTSAAGTNRKVVYINNCSPLTGCNATFKHEMKRTDNAKGSSVYKITRTSNAGSVNVAGKEAIPGGSVKGDTRFNPGSSDTAVDVRSGSAVSDTVKLYPGMVVCETVTFRPNNQVKINSSSYEEFKDGNVNVEICASALGNAQPDDPSDPDNPDDPNDPNGNTGNDAFVNMEVKNDAPRTSYNTYRHTVYSKPGDKLTFRGTYNPVLQYTYYLQLEQMSIACKRSSDNGLARTVGPYNNYTDWTQLGALYNGKYRNCGLGEVKGWNNDFTIFSSNFTTESFNKTYDNANGATGKVTKEEMKHEVQDNEVGANGDKGLISGTNKTNNVDTGRTTPGQVAFTDNGNYDLGTVDTGYRSSVANVRIPYNFRNTTKVVTDGDPKDSNGKIYVFSGETRVFRMNINVNPRQNDVTQGEYATIVKKARWKLELCYNTGSGDVCWETTPTDGYGLKDGMGNETYDDLNVPGSGSFHRNEVTTILKQLTVNVPDVPAGTDLCVRSAVYPANSGGPRNWTDPKGSDSWEYSPKVCYEVAKKPSLQVWGGNIYSAGKIDMAEARKTNLAGVADADWQIGTKNKNYIFGSWGELGLVSSGEVRGMSSGATIGYDSGSFGVPGGLEVKAGGGDICVRSVLTFANWECSSGKLPGSLGNAISTRNARSEKEEIIEKFTKQDEGPNVSGDVNLDTTSGKMIEDSVYYYYGNGSFALSGGRVQKGLTKVVRSDETITITNNVTYENGYNNYGNIPKLVVYAKNIKINCRVEQIDGVLIADKVETCADSSDINSEKNAVQLKINGAVITDQLVPKRTYGAATGNNSIVSAEIINFDPQLYKWGGQKIEGQTVNVNLDTVYSRELPPRL